MKTLLNCHRLLLWIMNDLFVLATANLIHDPEAMEENYKVPEQFCPHEILPEF